MSSWRPNDSWGLLTSISSWLHWAAERIIIHAGELPVNLVLDTVNI